MVVVLLNWLCDWFLIDFLWFWRSQIHQKSIQKLIKNMTAQKLVTFCISRPRPASQPARTALAATALPPRMPKWPHENWSHFVSRLLPVSHCSPCCHYPPFAHAEIAAEKLIAFRVTPVSCTSVNNDSADEIQPCGRSGPAYGRFSHVAVPAQLMADSAMWPFRPWWCWFSPHVSRSSHEQ